MSLPPSSPTSQRAFTVPLDALGRGDLALAGGKGANLGELRRAGFPVPDGFVVTTAAYDYQLGQSGVADLIEQRRQNPEPSGEALRSAIESAPIPAALEQAILDAYAQLGSGPVAVRSSATAEDLPDAAFAGQQDTFLNVRGPAALLSAVRSCWASLWTDRAIVYRARQGFDRQHVQLAVVVQRMATAEVAGVLFTANPVTGARTETVIDASPGLGEAVVSGLVTPDHFILRKSRLGLRIVERRLGRREVVIRPRAEGGTEHVTAADTATPRPSLPDAALRTLSRLGAAVARHFGAPQDIEWAWAAGKPQLLQARPITALPEYTPHRVTLSEELASVFADMLATRPYPIDFTTWGPGLYGAVLYSFADYGITTQTFQQMFHADDSVIAGLRADLSIRPTLRAVFAPAYLLWYCARYNPLHWREIESIPKAQTRVRELMALDLPTQRWETLVALVHEAARLPYPLLGEPRRRYSPRAMVAHGVLKALLWLVQHEDRLAVLESGLDTHTMAANRTLAALGEQVRTDPVLAELFARHDAATLESALEESARGRFFLAQVRGFIDRYGHREAVLLTITEPTWKDAPEVVFTLIKNLATTAPRPEPTHPAWQIARDELLALPAFQSGPGRAAFLQILAEARCLTEIREDTHFYGTLPMPFLRRALLELGRRLVDVGVLDTAADCFHFRFDELQRVTSWPPPTTLATELRTIMQRRRARRAALTGTPVVDPKLFRAAAPHGDVLASGTPGSPGIVQGPVCIIRTDSEFGKLRPGDILVAPFTNPAWTPLFLRAAAVVVDSGGAASHAAIVAREYGIPAVLGTGDGTQRLTDGAQVRVDGGRGVVLRV